MTRNDDVPVLIAGGSLVGLSTAVFLGHHGVPSLVLERHRGTAIHPRAALVNQRSIETYRAVGLQAEIEEAAAREFVQNGGILSVESLGGKELDWYFRFINEGVDKIKRSIFARIVGRRILGCHDCIKISQFRTLALNQRANKKRAQVRPLKHIGNGPVKDVFRGQSLLPRRSASQRSVPA